MANDLNNCQFIGRLGRDVDIRYMPSGDAIASFSLAVGSTWKDKQGAKQEATEWVSCTAFGKLGEICGQYLKKGSQVFVAGRMKTEKYKDKEGVEKYSTKIIVDRMQLLGSKNGDGAGGGDEHSGRKSQQASLRGGGASGFDDIDSDIPF